MELGTIKHRLTHDFQLTVLTLLGTVALAGLTPFALLRAINGQWGPFAFDASIEVVILGGVIGAWRSRDTRGLSLFVAYFLGLMAGSAVHVIGAPGEYWLYPAIIANFFFVDRRHALGIAVMALAIALFADDGSRPGIAVALYSVTTIVCALFGYAFAYRVAMQRGQLEGLASRDGLTGLFNRRTLIDELTRARRTFERERRDCGVLMLDLDHFKRINDAHGHPAGDRVLIELARLLKEQVRLSDRVFRYGGEEFVVLAIHTGHEGLLAMAEKLRGKVEREITDPKGQPVTVSIGGAVLGSGEAVDDWFARVDAALYAAKNAGRNRTVIDGGDGNHRP